MANRTNKKSSKFQKFHVTGEQAKDFGLNAAVLILAVFAIKGIISSLDGSMLIRSIIATAFVIALLFAQFLLIERMKNN